jgi:hypothetical protein
MSACVKQAVPWLTGHKPGAGTGETPVYALVRKVADEGGQPAYHIFYWLFFPWNEGKASLQA